MDTGQRMSIDVDPRYCRSLQWRSNAFLGLGGNARVKDMHNKRPHRVVCMHARERNCKRKCKPAGSTHITTLNCDAVTKHLEAHLVAFATLL